MFTRHPHILHAVVGALSLVAFSSFNLARAGTITLPTINMYVGSESSNLNVTAEMLAANSASVSENTDGSVSFLNGSLSTSDWKWNWTSLTVKTDPFVSSVFGFQNLSGVTTTFVVAVSIPVAPLGPSTLIGGSMGGSVTDANFNGLGGISTVAPAALYTGTIDGVGVVPAAELHPDPFSLTFAFPGDTVTIPSVSFGLPGPTVPGPAVASMIGITNKFSLSSMDIVSMTNFFVVQAVPEPSSIALAAIAGVALVWCVVRRRRVA